MKTKKIFFLLFLIAASSFAQKSLDHLLDRYNTRSIPYISVEELRMRQLKGNLVIFDAREKEEFEVSHISSAKYIGFKEFSPKEISMVDKSTPIVIYCSVGIRSEEIGEKLKKAGFNNVKNLYGGIFEWKNKGYPVIDSAGQETENVHAFSKMWSKWLHAGNPIY